MAPAAAGKRAHLAQAISHGAHAQDHHEPRAGLGHAARTETRDIAEELRRPWRYPDLVSNAVGAGEVGKVRQLPVTAGLQRLIVHQSVAPGINGRNPLGLGLDGGLDEFPWHLEHRRIVVAARPHGLVPDSGPQTRLDWRRDGRRGAAIAREGEQAALIARKDRGKHTSKQKQEQHRILLAALRAHPVGRPTGRNHLSPTPTPRIPLTIGSGQHD